jgi:alkanesulfonate monooxygenase SsuD/methylene tetrahydromethanopterin reductase-like flavin-dependent oxidoreductase (luciferase family)
MKLTIAGTPDTVAAKVRQLEEMGINHLHLRFMARSTARPAHICKDSAELFAREVMPRFKDTQASPQPELAAAK